MAMGSGVIILLTAFLFLGFFRKSIIIREVIEVLFVILVALVIVVINSGLSYLVNDSFNTDRFFLAFIYLFYFLIAIGMWVLMSKTLTDQQVDFAVRFVFYILLLCGFVSLFGYSPIFHTGEIKQVIFFSEPSHFAINFSPCLLYMVMMSQHRVKLVLLVFILGVLQQSLTLLVCVIIISILTFRISMLIFGVLACIGMWLIIGHEYIDFTYYTDRLSFNVMETNNLSVLHFFSGWERAYFNTIDSYGLGVGYLQMGIVGDIHRGPITDRIALIADYFATNKGDTNVAVKLISEFGVIAIIGLCLYGIYFIKCGIWLRDVSRKKINMVSPKRVFFTSWFVMYFVEIFLRGTGYFSSGAFLFIASIFWMFMNNRELKY